jgi:hypothetical protein
VPEDKPFSQHLSRRRRQPASQPWGNVKAFDYSSLRKKKKKKKLMVWGGRGGTLTKYQKESKAHVTPGLACLDVCMFV